MPQNLADFQGQDFYAFSSPLGKQSWWYSLQWCSVGSPVESVLCVLKWLFIVSSRFTARFFFKRTRRIFLSDFLLSAVFRSQLLLKDGNYKYIDLKKKSTEIVIFSRWYFNLKQNSRSAAFKGLAMHVCCCCVQASVRFTKLL